MDYDGSSEGGPRGSFDNMRSEGEVLFKQKEYSKALESFNTALEIRPGDKNCLVARSQCYLQLGESQKALADADETLKDDKNYIKGLLQKAEAYYQMGQFEYALMFYHRGYKLRPEVQEFRLGINKAQEAIDNSIGNNAGIELKNEGDLTYFYEEQQRQAKGKQKGKGSYGRPGAKKDEKDQRGGRPRQTQDKKTVKQLLGELYSDKEYLEKLLEETSDKTSNNSEINKSVHNLAENCLNYLDSRSQFWQQQKPMYARRHEQKRKERSRQTKSGSTRDPTDWILKNLDEIEQEQVDAKWEQSLKQAKKVLKEVEKWSDSDVKNRHMLVGNLHSFIGNSYLEMGEYQKALDHHTSDLEIAKQNDLEESKSRAFDNLGRVYARRGEFDKAIDVWEEKLPLSQSALETTWLCHEIGRCHLEVGRYKEAQENGEKSLVAAEEAKDHVWQLNARILIAQSQVKQGEHTYGLDTFERALETAQLLDDKTAEAAIKKAIQDVNSKIVSKEKESAAEEEKEEDSPPTAQEPEKEEEEKTDEPKETNAEEDKDKEGSDEEAKSQEVEQTQDD